MTQLPKHRLMIPGPSEMEEAVLAETGKQTAAHYGPAWVTLFWETADLLKEVFLTKGDVLLLFCSGSGGMEAALNSVFAPGDRIIVASNGFFGERIQTIATALDLEIEVVSSPVGEVIKPEDVRQAIAAAPDVRGLAAVHHETSTGVLNPLAEFGQIAREHNLLFIVDAISSLGGDPFYMDDWGVDICVTAANKCLGGPVGLAPVAINSRAWEVMDARPEANHGWYLNLRIWREYGSSWGQWHPHPVTMSSQCVTGLNAAVKLLLAQGLEQRWQAYRQTARSFRRAMEERGYTLFVDGETASSVITAVNARPGMDANAFITYLMDEHAIHVGGGIGEMRGRVLRVGHLGPAGSQEAIDAFLRALDVYDGRLTS